LNEYYDGKQQPKFINNKQQTTNNKQQTTNNQQQTTNNQQPTTNMTTYYYVLASKRFLVDEEPLEEVLRERTKNYESKNKEIDFWFVEQPAFLEAPELAEVKAKCPKEPTAAIISTDSQFITWLKLRLEYVAKGEFQAPSETIPDAIASLASVA